MHIIDLLKVVFNPLWWTRNYPTSRALSDFITTELDSGATPKTIDKYTMCLSGVVLWRASFPYAYGYACGHAYGSTADRRLPSRAVAIRLRRAELAACPDDSEAVLRAALARARGEQQC